MVAVRTAELDRTASDHSTSATAACGSSSRTRSGLGSPRILRSRPPDDVLRRQRAREVEVTENAVRADPELIMQRRNALVDRAQPTVLEISRQRPAAEPCRPLCHGSRSTAAAGALRAGAINFWPGRNTGRAADSAGLRSVREALLALERTVWLRLEMRSAFTGEPIIVERLEIPPW